MVLVNTTASTWVQRNPSRPRLHPRLRNRRINTAALQLLPAQKKKRHASLLEDLKDLTDDHNNRLSALAEKHSRKVDYLRKLLHTGPAYKSKRRPSLMNAIVHHKAQEMNDRKGKKRTVTLLTNLFRYQTRRASFNACHSGCRQTRSGT
jgi:type II secretory pathway predicted ATPase ExeA